MNKKQRQSKVIKILEKAKKLGLDMEKVTLGKELHTLAHSKVTVSNLEKRLKRQAEKPKIKKTLEKIQEQKRKSQKRNYISKKTKNIAKYNMDIEEPKKSTLREKTRQTMDEFLKTYFKQIRLESDAQKKIEKLKSRFGVRLDLAYEFMDYISDQSFKYEVDKEIYDRKFMKEELPDDFNSILYERLDEFDRILNREYKI